MMMKYNLWLIALLLSSVLASAQNKTRTTLSGNEITLTNGLVEAVFCTKETFDIKKLRLNGKELLKTGKNITPWILYYKGTQGESPELKPEHALYDGVEICNSDNAVTLIFTWQLTLDYSGTTYPVRMHVTLPNDSELLRWNIETAMPDGWMVTDLKFPRLTIERPTEAKILTTEGWGIERPLDITTFEARYPSHSSSMQFIIIHNNQGAFYYGTEDRHGCGKTYSAQCSHEDITFSDAIPASAGWIKDRTFRLPWESLVGYTAAGWADAILRWYRPFTYTTKWGSKTLADRGIPQWCYDTDVWIRGRHVTDDTLDAVKRAAKYFGKGYWHTLVLLAQTPLRHTLPQLLPCPG